MDGHLRNQSVSPAVGPIVKVSITNNACQSTANKFNLRELDEDLCFIHNHVRVPLEGNVGEVRGLKISEVGSLPKSGTTYIAAGTWRLSFRKKSNLKNNSLKSNQGKVLDSCLAKFG